jgi:translation elongation factor EF-Tu-like GTPase
MSVQVPFAATLRVELRLLGADEGGRTRPVSSGYRPLCQFTRPEGEVATVGMCQLELIDVAELKPGESAQGLLRFAPGLEDLVRELAQTSAEVALAEGRRIVGRARVTAID